MVTYHGVLLPVPVALAQPACMFSGSLGICLSDGASPKAICVWPLVTWKLAVCGSVDTSASMPGNSPKDLLIACRDVTILCLALTRAKL